MQDKIDSLIEQSHLIANEVRQGNWSVVEHLAEERQQHLEVLFSEPVPTEFTVQITQMVQDILALDKQVVMQIVHEKTETINSYLDIRSAKHAGKTYQNVAGLSTS